MVHSVEALVINSIHMFLLLVLRIFAENAIKFECDMAAVCRGFFLQFPQNVVLAFPHMPSWFGSELSTGPPLPK
jgi:hypothetical protein